MVSKFSVMLVAFVKCMFHNNLIDGPTVQPLYVKSKKQTFCECDGPGKKRFVSFDLGGHDFCIQARLLVKLIKRQYELCEENVMSNLCTI
jgi:hypothetical protein